jgi:hypothetical protein
MKPVEAQEKNAASIAVDRRGAKARAGSLPIWCIATALVLGSSWP